MEVPEAVVGAGDSEVLAVGVAAVVAQAAVGERSLYALFVSFDKER